MERGGVAIGFPCQGWLGEPGALWALETAPASNRANMMIELTASRFIPQRVETRKSTSYRCIPESMVVHINKEIQPEQTKASSIPISAGVKNGDVGLRFSSRGGKRAELFVRPSLVRGSRKRLPIGIRDIYFQVERSSNGLIAHHARREAILTHGSKDASVHSR